jgi:hypothetical protein
MAPSLTKFRIEDVLAKLTELFPHKFLEHKTETAHEVGLARLHAPKVISHTYRHCILIKSEAGIVTGLTFMSKLRIRPSPTKKKSFEFLSGAGMGVYRSPDGWVIKKLQEKSVSLTEELLMKRGWLFQETA